MNIRTAYFTLFICARLGTLAASDTEPAKHKLPGLAAAVEIVFDTHGIPHVFAKSWTDACRALGYVHASDRLWQMDMFRRRAEGTLSQVLGSDQLEHDKLVRRLGIARGCREIWESDAIPAEMRAQLEAYTEGVNARIEELQKTGFSGMFNSLDYEPELWKPVDCTTFGKYMAWDQSGTEDDLWFGVMVEKLGVQAVEELWPLDRPYEIPTVSRQADRTKLSAVPLEPIPGAADAFETARQALARAGWFQRGLSFGSNNWAVDGTKTKSGKPILASDPHLGFTLPSLWYTCHLSVNGRNVAGVTFPGSPVVIIGHNDRIGWGITNMQSDAVDYFVETTRPGDPLQYRHRGEWKRVERRTEQIPLRDEEPVEIDIHSTVHGPIISREGRAITLCWTGLGPTSEMIAFWEMNHAQNQQEWLAAADKITAPPLNLCYADAEGNILLHPCGKHPVRLSGRGRIPMDGASGDFDWGDSIPRESLPLVHNPAEHFVASANGRPAPLGYPYYLGWMWDPSYRTRRIHEMLSTADNLTIESMQSIQLDAHDLCAERFLPAMLSSLETEPLDDSYAKLVADALKQWNYDAVPDSVGPIVWVCWLDAFRSAVWDDEWTARGIKKAAGSWGFSGLNRREPMMEVLEFMTLENPEAIWFDDRATDEREHRDDIARRTFLEVCKKLQAAHGDKLTKLEWKHFNRLKINSMTAEGTLAREAGPVPGTKFTVNPGSDGGTVGGGASFRMIVDFGDPGASIGVYPGGQSDDPASTQYDDQMKLWAAGKYAPLGLVSDPSKLPTGTARTKRFVP